MCRNLDTAKGNKKKEKNTKDGTIDTGRGIHKINQNHSRRKGEVDGPGKTGRVR